MEELQAIGQALQEAKRYGLEAEIVWSALDSMKANPNQSLIEAIYYGMSEWIK